MIEDDKKEKEFFERKNNKKGIMSTILIILMLLICIGSVSFAVYSWNYTSSNANSISTCSINLKFLESDSVIAITNALPTYDATAKVSTTAGEKFDFIVSKSDSCSTTLNYKLTVTKVAVDSGMTALTNAQVKFHVATLSGATETQVLAPTLASTPLGASGTSGDLLTGQSLTGSTASKMYRFRMWIPDTVNASAWTSTSKYQYKVQLGVATV